MRGELKKAEKRQKVLFISVFFVSLYLLYILNERLSSGGLLFFQEAFYIPSLQDESLGGENSILKQTFYENHPDENPHKHHHEGHDHSKEIKFVLRDSNLGSPEFIGGNPDAAEFIKQDTVLNIRGIDMSSFSFADLSYKERNIAIGCALTTKAQLNLGEANLVSEMPFFKSLLPSFCLKVFYHHFVLQLRKDSITTFT